MAEINVTPMVDVMLVLLIIFMVSAPLLTVGDPTSICRSPRAASRSTSEHASADAVGQANRGRLQFQCRTLPGRYAIAIAELVPKIKAIRETRSDADSVVYLRGDKEVCYTDMMKLWGNSDCGLQGEYRHRSRAGLVSDGERRAIADGGAGRLT